jgi:hypothetical protein
MEEIYRKGKVRKQRLSAYSELVSGWFHFNKRRKDKEKIKKPLSRGKYVLRI